MGHNGNSYYIGIDLNDSYAMVSFFQQNMKEPETVSTVAGSEEFQIPLVLARRKSIGKWYYGDGQEDSLKAVKWFVLTSCLREH